MLAGPVSLLHPLWLKLRFCVLAMEAPGSVAYLLSGEVVPIDLTSGDDIVLRGWEARERLAASLGVPSRRLRMVNRGCGDELESDDEVRCDIEVVVCQASRIVTVCYDAPLYVIDDDRGEIDYCVPAKTSVTVWDADASVDLSTFIFINDVNDGMSEPCVFVASSCMRFATANNRRDPPRRGASCAADARPDGRVRRRT